MVKISLFRKRLWSGASDAFLHCWRRALPTSLVMFFFPSSDGDAFLHLGLLLRLRELCRRRILHHPWNRVFQIFQIYKIKLVSCGKGKKKKNHENRFTLGLCQIKVPERKEWRGREREREREKPKNLVHWYWFCLI